MQYPVNLKQRINQTLKTFKELQTQESFQFEKILKQVVCSQEIDNWIVLRELLQNKQIKQMPKTYDSILRALDRTAMAQQQSYVMLVFIYGWIKENKSRINTYKASRLSKQFVQDQKLFMLSSWLSESQINSPQISQTIKMMIRYYPILIGDQSIRVQNQQLQAIIQIICHADLKQSQQFQEFDKLCALVKRFIPSTKSYQQGPRGFDTSKQQIIIKTTLDVLANSKNSTGSASWLFIPPSLTKNDIQNFTYNYTPNILLYTENQLVNIFSKLFDTSLQENTLMLFYGFTRALKNQQKFYQMKFLYQKIVLPILIRRGKAKVQLTKQLLNIGTTYVIGFYGHCEIGNNGMLCLLSNIEKIEQNHIKKRWIELAFLVADKKNKLYGPIIHQELLKQKFNKKQLDQIEKEKGFGKFQDATIWQITKRNSQKLKTYSKAHSKDFKGIQNHGVRNFFLTQECYIISVMQALFTTKQLSRILKDFQYPPRDSLICKMKEFFQRLSDKYGNFIQVDGVKGYGPEYFAVSERQEDAQQYLSKVFEMIQQELGKYKERILLDEFNRAFKSKISRKLECQKCRNIIDKDEEQFIHTIPNRVSLREKQVEEISDYKCEKCRSTNFKNKIQLYPTSKILIVHFNRFSYRDQKSHKELATQSILRQFMGYRLRGIVFHIGKQVECGHYVYYYCCGGKKWVEMNDSNVMEFELDHEDEEFQRQMKAEMTPYILFYVKK